MSVTHLTRARSTPRHASPKVARAVTSHVVNLCYKHDASGWLMALIKVTASRRLAPSRRAVEVPWWHGLWHTTRPSTDRARGGDTALLLSGSNPPPACALPRRVLPPPPPRCAPPPHRRPRATTTTRRAAGGAGSATATRRTRRSGSGASSNRPERTASSTRRGCHAMPCDVMRCHAMSCDRKGPLQVQGERGPGRDRFAALTINQPSSRGIIGGVTRCPHSRSHHCVTRREGGGR